MGIGTGIGCYCSRRNRDGYENIGDGSDGEVLIPFSEIKMGEKIGRGSFGDIYRGEWRGADVAVKQIHSTSINDDFINDLWQEAGIMQFVTSHFEKKLMVDLCATPIS